MERQLLADLAKYGINATDLHLDWSHIQGERHWMPSEKIPNFDGRLENFSDIGVMDTRDNLIAAGWSNWIYADSDRLYIFWDLLRVLQYGQRITVKEFGIPAHLWNSLPDEVKDQCAQDRYWSRKNDPLVHTWEQLHRFDHHEPRQQ